MFHFAFVARAQLTESCVSHFLGALEGAEEYLELVFVRRMYRGLLQIATLHLALESGQLLIKTFDAWLGLVVIAPNPL